jgi:hypothetical protein
LLASSLPAAIAIPTLQKSRISKGPLQFATASDLDVAAESIGIKEDGNGRKPKHAPLAGIASIGKLCCDRLKAGTELALFV